MTMTTTTGATSGSSINFSTRTERLESLERPHVAISPITAALGEGGGETVGGGRRFSFQIPTQKDAEKHAHKHHGPEAWRSRVLRFLHWHPVQTTLMALLVADVVILFVEMFLMSLFPHCVIVERDAISCCSYNGTGGSTAGETNNDHHVLRFLAGGGGTGDDDHHEELCSAGLTPMPEYPAACDGHKWHVVHAVEEVLFSFTIFILSTMFLELNLEMIALGPCVFFRQFFYLLDYVIVTVSLVVELVLHFAGKVEAATFMGLLIMGRSWRFVRIGHGIVEVTAEINHKRFETLLQYTERLEEILQREQIEAPEWPTNLGEHPHHSSNTSHSEQHHDYGSTDDLDVKTTNATDGTRSNRSANPVATSVASGSY